MGSEHSGDRRQVVLDAALDIVADDGLAALTINELTVRSGVSNGSIYHHFGSRSGVVAALYRDSFQQCVTTLVTALDERPAAEIVPELAHRYLDWVARHPTRARFIYAASLGGDLDDVSDEVQRFKATVFASIVEWFSARMAVGELRPIPLWALDAVAMGPAHECARRFLAAPDHVDLDEMRRTVAEATWNILRPD